MRAGPRAAILLENMFGLLRLLVSKKDRVQERKQLTIHIQYRLTNQSVQRVELTSYLR